MRFALLDAVAEDRLDVRRDLVARDEEPALHQHRLERARELARRAIPLVLVLRERLQDDALEIALHAEQTLPRGELPQNDAEREDVGAPIELLARDLLGRHVRELAFERA